MRESGSAARGTIHNLKARSRIISVVALAALVASAVLLPAAPAGAVSGTRIPDGFYAMVVDPNRDQVYVSSAESSTVTVLDFHGRVLKVIDDEPGAAGMALVGNTLFVALSTGGAIDAIDTTTLTRTRRLAAEALFKPEPLVFAGGRLWTSTGDYQTKVLVAVDPVTGAVSEYGAQQVSHRMQLTGNPADPDMLIGWNNLSSATIAKWDVSADPPALLLAQGTSNLANLKDVAVSPDGLKLFPASGSPYEIDEYRTSDLKPSGIVYVTGPYPVASAVTGLQGGLMAAGMNHGDPQVQVFRLGNPSRRIVGKNFGLEGGLFDRSLDFSPDGSLLFAVTGTDDYYWGNGGAYFHVIRMDSTTAHGTGWNYYGQLGDGTRTDRTTLGKVRLNDPAGVAAGVFHTLAFDRNGDVWAWGDNPLGQLGNGSTNQSSIPVRAGAMTDVTALSAGLFHSLALKADGTVWAWGWNALGQLGDGSKIDRPAPVQVGGLSHVVAISAGLYHNLALKADGTVWAWGWNGFGQLGTGSTIDASRPVRVPNLVNVEGIAAGGYHSLAVGGTGGGVYSWGYNGLGELGDGTTSNRLSPHKIAGLTDMAAVSAGFLHSFAITGSGDVRAWGWNALAQLGDGTHTDRLSPVKVTFSSPVEAISAGLFHSAAISGERAYAWGWNGYGQLGNGTLSERAAPVLVPGSKEALVLGAGGYQTLIISPPTTP